MMWSACTEILIHRAEIEAAAKGNVCVDRALCLLVFSDTLSGELVSANLGCPLSIQNDTTNAAEVVEHYLCDVRPAVTGEHCQ
jgi:hypothetical protein